MPDMTDLDAILARDAIRELPLRYAKAIETRDVDAMAELFAADARFGGYGTGPDACRRLMTDTMADSLFAVILVTNHLIELDAADHARGEVWALCYAQITEGFNEQLLRYEDRYTRVDGSWKFLHRKHRLWYGQLRDASPLDQDPAEWPRSQVGVGDVPLADELFRRWWEQRRNERRA
jgi:hypothetical protein